VAKPRSLKDSLKYMTSDLLKSQFDTLEAPDFLIKAALK